MCFFMFKNLIVTLNKYMATQWQERKLHEVLGDAYVAYHMETRMCTTGAI